ncbi:MAG: Mg/Co/Ni transporter MgtE, CBS domain-containing, partial [uncultured Phycisphaerae bacterium]
RRVGRDRHGVGRGVDGPVGDGPGRPRRRAGTRPLGQARRDRRRDGRRGERRGPPPRAVPARLGRRDHDHRGHGPLRVPQRRGRDRAAPAAQRAARADVLRLRDRPPRAPGRRPVDARPDPRPPAAPAARHHAAQRALGPGDDGPGAGRAADAPLRVPRDAGRGRAEHPGRADHGRRRRRRRRGRGDRGRAEDVRRRRRGAADQPVALQLPQARLVAAGEPPDRVHRRLGRRDVPGDDRALRDPGRLHADRRRDGRQRQRAGDGGRRPRHRARRGGPGAARQGPGPPGDRRLRHRRHGRAGHRRRRAGLPQRARRGAGAGRRPGADHQPHAGGRDRRGDPVRDEVARVRPRAVGDDLRDHGDRRRGVLLPPGPGAALHAVGRLGL